MLNSKSINIVKLAIFGIILLLGFGLLGRSKLILIVQYLFLAISIALYFYQKYYLDFVEMEKHKNLLFGVFPVTRKWAKHVFFIIDLIGFSGIAYLLIVYLPKVLERLH
jgi:hypothetical protein